MPLPDPIPDLRALDLLVTVGQLGSISSAADLHGVTQPAASMRIRSLERSLGLKLLARTSKGSELTPAGAATAEWARRVLAEMDTLLSSTAALSRQGRRHLRVAGSMTVAEYLVPGWFRQLSAVASMTTLSLEMGNTARVNDLVLSGRVDVGFIEGARPVGRVRSMDLQVDELSIVVGEAHPWFRRRKAISVQELAETPLLMREVGSGTRDVLTDELRRFGFDARVLMELGSTTAIKAAAVAGVAPAVLSRLAVAGEIAAGTLVRVASEGLELSRVIRAIWLPSRPPQGAVAQLVSVASGTSGNRRAVTVTRG